MTNSDHMLGQRTQDCGVGWTVCKVPFDAGHSDLGDKAICVLFGKTNVFLPT